MLGRGLKQGHKSEATITGGTVRTECASRSDAGAHGALTQGSMGNEQGESLRERSQEVVDGLLRDCARADGTMFPGPRGCAVTKMDNRIKTWKSQTSRRANFESQQMSILKIEKEIRQTRVNPGHSSDSLRLTHGVAL